MPTTVTHNNNNSVTVILDPSPLESAGQSIPALLVPLADNPLGDPAQRIVSYSNYDEAFDAEAAGDISASTLAALEVGFTQTVKPRLIKVINIDLANNETIPTALAAAKALDDTWYGLSIWSRANADVVAASGWIETQQKILLLSLRNLALWVPFLQDLQALSIKYEPDLYIIQQMPNGLTLAI